MRKYRCPKCGEFYEGEAQVCPHCGALMKYRNVTSIEEEIKQETIVSTGPKFNFHGKDVVYHPDSIFDEEQYESIDNSDPNSPESKEDEIIKAPEHYEKMVMEEGKSYFDGKALSKFGWSLLELLITLCTAFIGFPWAMCMKYRYETKHTVINGRRLCFDGKGSQLFGRFLLSLVLTILTVGIYGISFSERLKNWKIKHTHFLTTSGEKI